MKSGNDGSADLVKDGLELENDFFKIKIDETTGTISHLYDRLTEDFVLKKRWDEGAYPENTFPVKIQTLPGNIPATRLVRSNLMQAHFEEPHAMSAWVIGPIKKVENLTENPEIEVLSKGPVVGKGRIKRKFYSSFIIQDLVLYTGIPRIDFFTTIE